MHTTHCTLHTEHCTLVTLHTEHWIEDIALKCILRKTHIAQRLHLNSANSARNTLNMGLSPHWGFWVYFTQDTSQSTTVAVQNFETTCWQHYCTYCDKSKYCSRGLIHCTLGVALLVIIILVCQTSCMNCWKSIALHLIIKSSTDDSSL